MQRFLPAGCRNLCTATITFAVLAVSSQASAQAPLHVRMDQAIASGKPDFAKQTAGPAADAEFLRRVYLDLAGVIPSADEARAFLRDPAPDKRQKLIDRLLASSAFARHMQNVFDVLLLDRRPDKHVQRGPWREYLRTSFAANKPYDQLVREILSADGRDPKQRPAAKFFLDRDGEPHQLTRDISRLFLGMNLHCAQCHDHPLVTAYRQEHYYGIYAFLNRSFVFADKAKRMAVFAEKAEGEVSFQSVFVPKVTKNTGPRLPDGAPLPEPKLEKASAYVQAPGKGVAPVPKYSRRAQLAGQITGSERFRRAAVNRFWFLMLGRGLVHPVELDHPANPPSHPELLKMLADEFAAGKFDVKAFVREVALSQTYQRSSELPKGVSEVPEDNFAVAILRPLSPEQMAWSMMQGTGLLDAERKAQGKTSNEDALYARFAGNEAPFVSLFGSQAGEPASADFQATLDQTLFLLNGALVRGWLAPRPGNLIDRLSKLKDAKEVADELYLSVLTRYPTEEERRETAEFLAGRAADRPVAFQDLAWALLASAEFRFNH
jgi:hypothetical protein